jgi:hypothetical protein
MKEKVIPLGGVEMVALASLIFSEWRRQTKGPEIMKALDLTRKEYDTAVRRMDRAIQKRWPEGMPHVR